MKRDGLTSLPKPKLLTLYCWLALPFDQLDILSTKLGNAVSISSGCKSTTMSNKSCGCSVVLGKRFANARQYPPCEAKGEIQGRGPRGISIRVTNGIGDFNAIACHSAQRCCCRQSPTGDLCWLLHVWQAEKHRFSVYGPSSCRAVAAQPGPARRGTFFLLLEDVLPLSIIRHMQIV